VEVLKRFKVDLFIETNTTSTSAVYRELEDLIKEKNIKKEIITSPEILTLGSGTEFNILYPMQDTAGWDTNDSSIVGKLIYGNNSFLLTGDSPQKIEKYLVGKYGSSLKSDVLKVGHHGSKNSSSEIFIGTVSPTYSIISAGLDNRYGHPHQEIIDILNNFKTNILKTFEVGNIIFSTDGGRITVSY
jgi:competence protein ComEC